MHRGCCASRFGGLAAARPSEGRRSHSTSSGQAPTAATGRAFCEAQKAGMVTRYGEPGFGGESWCRFWRREQAKHRVGDRKGLGRGGGPLDFQLSRRAVEGKRRGVGGGVW